MDIEHNPHSVGASFWCQAYLKAMEVGHKDPAVVADAAFVDFESRFGVQADDSPQEQECLCGGGVSLQSVSGGAHATGLYGTVWLNVEGETVEYARVKVCEQPHTADAQHTEVLTLVPKADVGKVDTSTSALAVDAAVGLLAQAGIMASDAERMRDVATGVLAGAQNAMLPGVVIGDGPSIEAGDALPLEHGWQAGHVVPEEGEGNLG